MKQLIAASLAAKYVEVSNKIELMENSGGNADALYYELEGISATAALEGVSLQFRQELDRLGAL